MQPWGPLIVTPEAVELELPTASVLSRALARGLDLLASVLALLALGLLASVVPSPWGLALLSVSVFMVVLGYPVLFEGFGRGCTLGKFIAGLRVVRDDGGPIGLREAAVRGALGILDIFATSGSLAVIVALISSRDQRLGDMAAGTLVVRVGRRKPVEPVWLYAPPGCEPIVASLDVATMVPADYEVVRAFLLRWPEFGAPQRLALASQLAGPLWQRFRHQLPMGFPPDLYLACLGCAFQRQRPYVAHAGPTT